MNPDKSSILRKFIDDYRVWRKFMYVFSEICMRASGHKDFCSKWFSEVKVECCWVMNFFVK